MAKYQNINDEKVLQVAVGQLLKQERDLTPAVALKCPSLKSLEKDLGFVDLLRAVSNLITLTVRMFNVSTPMSGIQITTTASDLISKYPHETFEDFCICFRDGRRGEYGKTFNRIDSEVIFLWMQEYLKKKYEEKEKQVHNEKYPARTEENANFLDVFLEKAPKHLIDKMKELNTKPKNGIESNSTVQSNQFTSYGGYLEHLTKIIPEAPVHQLMDIKRSIRLGSLSVHSHKEAVEMIDNEIEERMKYLREEYPKMEPTEQKGIKKYIKTYRLVEFSKLIEELEIQKEQENANSNPGIPTE